MSGFVQMVLEYLQSTKYWKKIQPYVLLVFGWFATEVLAFEYIQSQFGFTPSYRLFFGSYFFVRIAIIFGGLALLVFLFQLRPRRDVERVSGTVSVLVRRHQGLTAFRTTAALVVLALGTIAYRRIGPHEVSTIGIKLLNEPEGFRTDVLAYLVYELNRQQKNWYYEMDFEPFNPRTRTSAELAGAVKTDRPKLYFAELLAKDRPLIAITEESLGGAFFCEHRAKVSVISTVDRNYYAPLSTYEYLAYCLVVQSIMIHLDTHGRGLPPGAFQPGATSHGGIFQFNPNKEALKPGILAARLSPDEEAMLFNRFGADYMNVCRQLLSLEWLRSERVMKNLVVYFQAKDAVTLPVASEKKLE